MHLLSVFPHIQSLNAHTLTMETNSRTTFAHVNYALIRDSDQKGLYCDSQGNLSFSSTLHSRVTFESITPNVYIKVDNKYLVYDGTCVRVSATPVEWIWMPSTPSPDVDFVIARYNENVDWAQYLPGHVFIYNKGSNDIQISGDNISIIQLQNVGREGHTYLHHIIQNYKYLAKTTVFLQGNPFDHSNHLLQLVRQYNDFSEFQPLSTYYQKGKIPPASISDKYTETLYGSEYATYHIKSDLQLVDFHDHPLEIWTCRVYKSKHKCTDIIPHFLARCRLDVPPRPVYSFVFAALFAVSCNRIRKYKVEQYTRIKEELLRYHPQGGVDGYVLERLWPTIFE